MRIIKKCLGKFYKACSTEKGVSIPELLMATMIFLMLVSGVYASLAAGNASWQVNSTRTQLRQNLRNSMDNMVHYLQEAGSSSVVNVPADGSVYDTITFKTAINVTMSGVVWDSSNTVFQRNGTNLERTTGAGTQVLAQNISALGFSRQSTSPDIMEVSITAFDTTNNGLDVTEQLDFQVKMRN